MRNTRLTRACKLFLDHVSRVFVVSQQGRDSVKAAANGFRGQLRIALSDGITLSRLPALLALCRQEAPEVEIRLAEVLGSRSMVEGQLPKLHTRVRFPSPAPAFPVSPHLSSAHRPWAFCFWRERRCRTTPGLSCRRRSCRTTTGRLATQLTARGGWILCLGKACSGWLPPTGKRGRLFSIHSPNGAPRQWPWHNYACGLGKLGCRVICAIKPRLGKTMPHKTPERKAAEQLRYTAACGAANAAELEPFLTDPNQAIRPLLR